MIVGNDRPRVLAAGIVATGIAVICLLVGWSSETTAGAAGLTSTVTVTGADLAPWAVPSALAAGASFLALIVAGRRLRRLVAAVAALAGVAVAAAGVLHFGASASIGAVIAGLVMAAAGTSAAINSGRWPDPSARYDAKPADDGGIPKDPAKLWNALDSGQDPSSPKISGSARRRDDLS